MDLVRNAPPKPVKGSGLIERKTRAKDIKAFEDAEKDKVRARDKRCRWPHCQYCRAYKPRLEVAHLKAKGQGGDHGERSTADQMILLDFITHQGHDGLEQHRRRIVPLTPAGTNGPCDFYATGEDGRLFLVAREIAPFYYERD